ncbi:multicomponent Na+:H+ antiporter subunit E [Klenkia marina]|uniref:Multicomponent Na+:H+ antiporter subunit E n=1 Tax=Klenkia marina TaxID=1960309 RepID=A0A1G4XF03_9ACTN|nr:Na+/H+ antiporter subunit E [Klenkia marina]SCX39779.1 multicomponent Na+:H+ antiporter subunit E [Klenkia marina]
MSRLRAVVSFAAWYVGQFLVANVRVAGHVLRPRLAHRPVVVRYELRGRTDVEVASFIALVSLTPGTLVVDRAEGVVTVHAVHALDCDRELAAMRDLEDRMLAAFGPRGRTT